MQVENITRPVLSEAGRAALAQCAQIVSAESDPWARTWRDASRGERKVLLRIAGLPEGWADTHAKWASIPEGYRAQIKQRARDMSAWLSSVLTKSARTN
ncbi:hypothetical protein [Uliginosibacterium gangwonense]|uniref:hypothetical protein n=1 Tax=Uliginosibacterium gangwonense TaxID=392736 RepID=UPI00036B420A|nr:hypothetical protein [Uliginosibacterium gangwonense]